MNEDLSNSAGDSEPHLTKASFSPPHPTPSPYLRQMGFQQLRSSLCALRFTGVSQCLGRAREGRARGPADRMLVGLLLPLKQTPPLPASSCALHLLIKDPIPSLLPPNNYGGRPTEGLCIRRDWGKPAGISPRLAPCLSGLPSTPPVTLAQLLRLHHWLKGVPAVKALFLVTKRSSKEWK